MFGADGNSGIPPRDPLVFSATGGYDGVVEITVRVYDATYEGAQVISTTGGVKILRKQGSAPRGYEDGTLVADLPIQGSRKEYNTSTAAHTINFRDTGLTNNVTYYYAAFPYSDHGVINYRMMQISSAKPIPKPSYEIWAFNQDFTNLDPSKTITYPINCNNANFVPLMTNDSNGSITVGSWKSFLEDTLKNFPYVVDVTTGKAIKQINPNDRTKYIDGTTIGKNDGSHFAWIEKLYMHEEYSSDGTSREVQFCNKPKDGFYSVGFYNYNESGNVTASVWSPRSNINGMWIPMYPVSGKPLAKGYSDENAVIIPITEEAQYGSPIASQGSMNNTYGSRIYGGIKNNGGTSANLDISGVNAKLDGKEYNYEYRNVEATNNAWGPIRNYLRDLLFMMTKTTNLKWALGYGLNFDRTKYKTASTASAGGKYVNMFPFTSTSSGVNGFKGHAHAPTYTSNNPVLEDEMFYSKVLMAYGYSIYDNSLSVTPIYSFNTFGKWNINMFGKLGNYSGQGGSYSFDDMVYSSNSGGYVDRMVKLKNEYGSVPVRLRTGHNVTDKTGICAFQRADGYATQDPGGNWITISGHGTLFNALNKMSSSQTLSNGTDNGFSNFSYSYVSATPSWSNGTISGSEYHPLPFVLYAPLFIPPADYSPTT